MLEGTVAGVPPRGGQNTEQPLVNINTKIFSLFVAVLSTRLERIIAQKRCIPLSWLCSRSRVEHVEANVALFPHVEPRRPAQLWLHSWVAGRLPIITALQPLSNEGDA